jgi:hypothetical protein
MEPGRARRRSRGVTHAAYLAAAGAGTAALLLADRLLLWMESRGWIYWRKRRSFSSLGVDLMRASDPGAQAVRRAMEQERVRRNVRPAEDPPVQVDLEAGIARIRRTGADAPIPPPPKEMV